MTIKRKSKSIPIAVLKFIAYARQSTAMKTIELCDTNFSTGQQKQEIRFHFLLHRQHHNVLKFNRNMDTGIKKKTNCSAIAIINIKKMLWMERK